MKRALVTLSHSQSLMFNAWFHDSGTTDHLCSMRNMFSEFSCLSEPVKIFMGDYRYVLAIGIGSVTLQSFALQPHSVYCVPRLGSNVISVGQLLKDGYCVNFDGSQCIIQDSQGHCTFAAQNKVMFQLEECSHRSH